MKPLFVQRSHQRLYQLAVHLARASFKISSSVAFGKKSIERMEEKRGAAGDFTTHKRVQVLPAASSASFL
jgi:hypothetical protein